MAIGITRRTLIWGAAVIVVIVVLALALRPKPVAADFGNATRGPLEVTLVEASKRLGGTCLLRGCIPSKALLHVARVIAEVEELGGDWGVEYGPPRINVDQLRARKEKVIQTLSGGLKQLAKRRKVRILNARGTLENSTTLRLAADSLSGSMKSKIRSMVVP